MARAKVAVLRTSPRTVFEDYHRVMNLGGVQEALPKSADTALKINISWHFFYPGCSTTPWQLDGVIRAHCCAMATTASASTAATTARS